MDYRTIRPAKFGQGAGAEPAIPASELELDDIELRVVGSLVEKETTTPDYYPLTSTRWSAPVIRSPAAIRSSPIALMR
jgi:hypothetical protein